MISKVLGAVLASLARLIAGGTVRSVEEVPPTGSCIFLANHTSHLDFIVLWAYLSPSIRERTRPIAAKEYWEAKPLRRFLAAHVFRALLIERRGAAHSGNPHAGIDQMADALGECSLILFPEGTRGSGERVAAFHSGIYYLCRERPEVPVIPVFLENLNRMLPKGRIIPVPMVSRITFGAATTLKEGETKQLFLERLHSAMEALSHDAPA